MVFWIPHDIFPSSILPPASLLVKDHGGLSGSGAAVRRGRERASPGPARSERVFRYGQPHLQIATPSVRFGTRAEPALQPFLKPTPAPLPSETGPRRFSSGSRSPTTALSTSTHEPKVSKIGWLVISCVGPVSPLAHLVCLLDDQKPSDFSPTPWNISTPDCFATFKVRNGLLLASMARVVARTPPDLAAQVQFLCTFFGSMFSVDPRAGIAPSTRALWSLCRMRNYSPAMGAQIVSQVLLLGDDFSKQPTPARWEVYELLLRLFEDDRVLGELEHVFGPSAGCIVDLIRLCQREREPSSLLSYLTILRRLISAYAASPDVDEELFRAFSNYFPISLNNKISSTAVTTTELKVALRACFSAHQRLASLAFPFLLGKLDISEPASREVDNVSTKVYRNLAGHLAYADLVALQGRYFADDSGVC